MNLKEMPPRQRKLNDIGLAIYDQLAVGISARPLAVDLDNFIGAVVAPRDLTIYSRNQKNNSKALQTSIIKKSIRSEPLSFRNLKESSRKSLRTEKEREFSPLTVMTPLIETADNVDLPEQYRRFLPDQERINSGDLAFFEGIVDKYGLSERKGNSEIPTPPLGEAEFFDAVAEVAGYALHVRSQMIPNRNDAQEPIIATSPETRKIEKIHPSSRRIQDLCALFLHQPQIKAAYMKIHARKMAEALPSFSEGLTAHVLSGREGANQKEYFTSVLSVMNDAMLGASHNFIPEQIDALAIIMGYQEHRILIPPVYRRILFSNMGNGTFTSFLDTVVTKAAQEGQDVASVVRREFLAKDGAGFRIMRTHLFGFSKPLTLFETSSSLEEARTKLAEGTYIRGACPAILKTDSLDGSGTQRPIAYEYASVIVNNMPDFALKNAA